MAASKETTFEIIAAPAAKIFFGDVWPFLGLFGGAFVDNEVEDSLREARAMECGNYDDGVPKDDSNTTIVMETWFWRV